MLEKLAPTWLAGMPAIIKPATATAQVTQAMVKSIIDSGLAPDGAISLICGGAGDLLSQLDSQDVVTFTGSASTGQSLRVHHCRQLHSFTMEADSLNCCVLGDDVTPEQPEFALFIREVVREMTAKAGQKCTAIRRIIVPQSQVDAVSQGVDCTPGKSGGGRPGAGRRENGRAGQPRTARRCAGKSGSPDCRRLPGSSGG
jgi:oxepin-CoA hydrolase/3-oxo-5,6-dehydrosuberyl-CoA semialdehyde dehydrogenase